MAFDAVATLLEPFRASQINITSLRHLDRISRRDNSVSPSSEQTTEIKSHESRESAQTVAFVASWPIKAHAREWVDIEKEAEEKTEVEFARSKPKRRKVKSHENSRRRVRGMPRNCYFRDLDVAGVRRVKFWCTLEMSGAREYVNSGVTSNRIALRLFFGRKRRYKMHITRRRV